MTKSDFDFSEYVKKMSKDRLSQFAYDSGTTARYIKTHLIYKKKIPKPKMVDSLVLASNGDFSKTQFILWLYNLKVD